MAASSTPDTATMKSSVLRMGDSGRWIFRRELGAASRHLLQLDLAVEFDVDPQPGDLQRHVRGKGFGSRDLLAIERLRDRLLDLALRVDAHHLQKLADAQVKGFLIHRALRSWTARIIPCRCDARLAAAGASPCRCGLRWRLPAPTFASCHDAKAQVRSAPHAPVRPSGI